MLFRSGRFERMIGAVLGDGFERSRTQLHRYETIKFGHPDPPSLKIRHEKPWCVGSDMLAHAALFLGHTTTMDDMSLRGFRAGDAADSRHRTPFGKEREDAVLCLGRQVKMSFTTGRRQIPRFLRL